MFRGVRIVLRGLSDTLENLLQFFLFSISWWVCVLSVVLAPGATLALFKVTDPRIVSVFDRPGVREFFAEAVRQLRRGWKICLVTAPIIAILIYNLIFYGKKSGAWALLFPAWFALLLVAALITTSGLSIAALGESSPVQALKTGAILTGARLWHALVVAFLLWVLSVVSVILIVPAIMFLPATIAATINRLVLEGMHVPIFDPLAPTEERLVEEAAGKSKRRWGP